MELSPLKSFQELMEEYDRRKIAELKREGSIRRVPGAILLVAFFIGYCALVVGLVNYSTAETGTGCNDPEVEAMGY